MKKSNPEDSSSVGLKRKDSFVDDEENLTEEERRIKELEIIKLKEREEDCNRKLKELSATYPEIRVRLNRLKESSIHSKCLKELYAYQNQSSIKFCDSNADTNVTLALCPFITFLKVNTPLIHLDLSNNPIGSQGFKAIGNALESNGSITYLNLSECHPVDNPYRPNYVGLNALARGIQSKRSKLQTLIMARMALQPNGARIILVAVAFHQSIQMLDISDTCATLNNLPDGILALCTVLSCNKYLHSINFSGNPCTRQAFHLIQEAVMKNKSLTELYLNRCDLSYALKMAKIDELFQNSTLKNVEIND